MKKSWIKQRIRKEEDKEIAQVAQKWLEKDKNNDMKDRNRSLWWLLILILYGMADAYVDAHLDKDIGTINKMIEQNKTIEIISSISIIHLIFLVVFSIVIREEIIQKIDMFYNLLYTKYLSFSGKSV